MSKKAANKLETWGNETTMNLNAILYQNILASPYFKSLYEKKTFHEIVDEIYNEVYNLSPFIKGTAPSTAFCCLYKFWTLRLTVKQIENLIDHPDSPYIRAVGFLYLRYVCAPAQYWDWFQYYLDDDTEIDMSGGPRPQKSTIGKLCRMLLTEQKFQGTMLPRIPVPIARDLTKKLGEYDQEARHHRNDRYNDDAEEEEDDRRSYRHRDRSRSPRDRRDFDDDRRRRRGRDRSRDDGDDDRYRSRGNSRYRSRSRDRKRSSRYDDDDDDHYRRRRRSVSPRNSSSRYDDRDQRRSHSRSRYSKRSRSRSYSRDRGRY
ncbi:PRP38 family-domain-containing protein [Zychaea mexicana]|uniref:PRP38 family-domain-containing protein n=1 Tax=Zychaea mexicana TaxID=64656 RepID=UPI0022FE69B8|nr:PRP38 family-domain-containing protein [Zychaea mexicana]KAI9494127.1 PRP38 family-domain-containing protein [Zychaea mexicana]